MGGAVSAGEDNDELIDNLVQADYIKTQAIEDIFRAVDRADYYVEGCKENAYRDLAWKHGNLHLSAPCIYSEVMESLKLQPGMSFLNLGSGTGYLSTMAGLILGTYGINHGIELHCDVVNYANTKLEEFKSSSTALDKYEFCAPNFVAGNCLLLECNSQQYDRVYCGASCPLAHEDYMKNLIRIGGILVMPLNDHLLQITRTSDVNWEVKNILPVSFASLVLPGIKETQSVVSLPETHPLSLQEICRSTVRVILRKNVDIENPTLRDRKKLCPKRKRAKRRVRRIVIPIYEESDDSRRSSQADVNDNYPEMPLSEEGERKLRPTENLSDTDDDNDDGKKGEKADEPLYTSELMELIDEDDIPLHRCEGSHINDSIAPKIKMTYRSVRHASRSTKHSHKTDAYFEEYRPDKEMTEPSADQPSCSRAPSVSLRKKDSHDRKRSAEDDDDDDASDPRSGRRADRMYLGKRTTAVIFKRVAFSEINSDVESDSEKESVPIRNEETPRVKVDALDYTHYMKQKINQLPLPYTLKVYLNFSRPV